jgi:hypothetical protein
VTVQPVAAVLFCRVCNQPLEMTGGEPPSRCAECQRLATRRAARWLIDKAKTERVARLRPAR